MIHRLEPAEYVIALPVLDGVEHALLVNAVIERTAPGWVVVDSRDDPRVVFALVPGEHHLIGQPQDEAFHAALTRLLNEELLPRAREAGWAVFNLQYWPDHWEPVLDAILGDAGVVKNYERFYKHRQQQIDWQDRIHPGFALRQLDAALLEQAHLKNVERIRGDAEDYFHSVERFLERGFGFGLIHDDEIVSWCTSDCVSGNRCEIGAYTVQEHRRRGFATLTVAATVDHCLSHGLTDISWHCWSQNLASAATAERVGFEEVAQHHAVHVWLNPVDGLLVNGNLALMQGRYQEAGEFYERAFATRETAEGQGTCLFDWSADEATYLYHAACAWALAGDREAALRDLEKALGKGSFRQGGY